MREKPLILITDDEPNIREIVKIKLEANGFEVKEAENGVEGFRIARELKPDIMLLDIVMPGMDGIEILLKLKENEKTKKIKVFLFTGEGDPRLDIVQVNRRFAMESGAVDFIRKEIDLNELVSKLQKTIQELKNEEEYRKKREELLN
ncbi:MAG: response regulator [bacterium]|nr:response regulator [bacterium]